MSQRYRLGVWAVLALVALRMAAGWHFFKEGTKKFYDPKFSSAFLFQSATGPLAGFYRSQIPDRFGYRRLDPRTVVGDRNDDRQKPRDQQVLGDWDRFVERAKRHYGFNSQQQKEADRQLIAAEDSYRWFYGRNRPEIDEFFLQVGRLNRDLGQPVNREVEFARKRLGDRESELRGKVAPWLNEISAQYADLELRMYRLADNTQRLNGRLRIEDPGHSQLDEVVKYVITGVGVLLLLGLFTRLAAVVGAVFLLTVMGTQPPWAAEASTQFFYYQFVEFWALMVLVAFAAGRYAGLDYVLAGLWSRCCGRGQ
jgi:uncharacterized membrane protein YphA (DoxX/SURF4 family)